jgi:DNA-binding LacI/PurR family transcriptional regulator
MVSSRDVAKYAGVSQSTVSRVLNNPDKVSKPIVDRVTEAMKALNYRPNNIARSLVSNQTKTIALISGPLHNPFFVDTTTAIVNYAASRGYNTTVHFENHGDHMSVYETVLSQQVDGIVLSSIFINDPIYEELKESGIPFVMFNRRHHAGGHFVEIDNYQAGVIGAEHLVSLGHTAIAWVGGPTKASTFLGRFEGFSDTLIKNGIPVLETLTAETDTTEQDVIRAVDAFFSGENKPTGIFAATDSMAIFIMDYLLKAGLRIPDDVSVCGIDNLGIAAHESFQLTSVGSCSDEHMGLLAIKSLLEVIEGQDEPADEKQITLEPKLYTRRTTSKR